MSTIEKPQLRNLLKGQIKRNIIGMIVVSVTSAMLFKIFVADRRKQRYVEFYKYVIFKILWLSIPIPSSSLDSCTIFTWRDLDYIFNFVILQNLRCGETAKDNERGWSHAILYPQVDLHVQIGKAET